MSDKGRALEAKGESTFNPTQLKVFVQQEAGRSLWRFSDFFCSLTDNLTLNCLK